VPTSADAASMTKLKNGEIKSRLLHVSQLTVFASALRAALTGPRFARLDSPLVILMAAAISYTVFLGKHLSNYGFDPSICVMAGDQFCDPGRVPPNLTVRPRASGYDGQFYYRLALDPFTSRTIDRGIVLDAPAYRQQRILYPLVAHLLSFGRAGPVPAVMVLVNLLAVCLIGWLGGAYAQALGRHALWAAPLAFHAGFPFTLVRDTPEILEICLLLASLLLLRRGRHVAATVTLALAVLTKETALLAAAGAGVAFVAERFHGRGPGKVKWYYPLAPLVVFLAWQWWLLRRWERLPLGQGSANLAWPMEGFVGLVESTAQTAFHERLLWFTNVPAIPEIGFIITFTALVALSLRASLAERFEKISWVLYLMLAVTLSHYVWVEDWAFMRALSEFYLFGAIILLGAGLKLRGPAFAASLALWLYLGLAIARGH